MFLKFKMNKLTEKKYWELFWKNLKLPCQFSKDYAHKRIYSILDKFINPKAKKVLEIGGCPGKWAHYFNQKFSLICDSMEYSKETINITKKNYELLNIPGKVFFGDITQKIKTKYKAKYDIVISEGLFEHFKKGEKIFENHLTLLKKNGLLIIGVPNNIGSPFYNFLSRIDKESYEGHRHVSIKEFRKLAFKNNLKILFCNYIGVFHIGLVGTPNISFFLKKLFTFIYIFQEKILNFFNIKKES